VLYPSRAVPDAPGSCLLALADALLATRTVSLPRDMRLLRAETRLKLLLQAVHERAGEVASYGCEPPYRASGEAREAPEGQ